VSNGAILRAWTREICELGCASVQEIGTASNASAAIIGVGPLAGIAGLIVLAIWIIGSTLCAPLAISVMLGGVGHGATTALFGPTLGRAGSVAGSVVAGHASNVLHGAISSAMVIGGSAVEARINAPRPNFSRRPSAHPESIESDHTIRSFAQRPPHLLARL
jgi:hypothetical protein